MIDNNELSVPDQLRILHGSKGSDIYVVLSADGSTVLKDPGMKRPYSTRNKKLAEHHAKLNDGIAVDLITAVQTLIRHPKNLPPGALPPPAGL